MADPLNGRHVRIGTGVRLWVEQFGEPDHPTVLLVMGANAPGLVWPDPLVERLAARYHVVRYDHRDTGRSSRSEGAYSLRDLAADAIGILDALGVDRAHVVGMSLGGVLVQLLLLDHPQRLLSATVLATAALGDGLADPSGTSDLPGPSAELLEFWATMGADRDVEAELDWRVEHWRILRGTGPFDPAEFRALEERVMRHSGETRQPTAHATADQGGLERGAELAGNRVPTLVVEAPLDPINPPPHAENLRAVIGSSTLVRIAGMGHALSSDVLPDLGTALLRHLDAH
ncbi:alpha/beta fold hydrolase [Kineococcus gynurae]|uniref:Alpha/beta fold hydrolase n=1 Tax=Kineococcus gynurae TaxID=452979 RepID=A0ABV5LS65_9ACTN